MSDGVIPYFLEILNSTRFKSLSSVLRKRYTMIVIEGKKYSCDTCIKGHRSSACKHTDRPLFEIQRKGRPVTQCQHCRELRKTKQVHVKCKCGDARSGKGDSGSASKKTHDPAFPNGVPEHLTAIVTLISEHGSDSEHAANPKAGPCPCNPGGKCTCATARKSKRSTGPEPPLDPSTAVKPSTGQEYRRVLPKPQTTPPAPLIRPGPVHSPSSTGNGKQSQRPRVHPDSLYSPYERAYDANHSHQTSSDHSESELSPMEVGPSYASRPPGDQGSFGWGDYPALSQRSLCACGNSCPCPGCFEHRGPSALQAYQGTSSSPCANPRYCVSCVECAVVLGHPNQQPAAPGSFDTRATSFMDEWLRQLVEGMPTLPADGDTLHPATPMPSRSTQSPPGLPDCCGGSCGCQGTICVCGPECFGGRQRAWGEEGNATGMSIGPTSSLPPIGLGGWDVPVGDQSWILAEHGISSDGSSEGEAMPGANQAGDFKWGV